jgi:hypothetical protein
MDGSAGRDPVDRRRSNRATSDTVGVQCRCISARRSGAVHLRPILKIAARYGVCYTSRTGVDRATLAPTLFGTQEIALWR